MGYICIFILSLINILSTILRKNYTKNTIEIKTSLNIYMLIAHPIAAIYFLIIARGDVSINTPTFWFSISYAFICAVSVLCTMLAYDKIDLIYITVFSGAGGVIIPFIFETFLRNEHFTTCKLLSIVIRLIAVCVPLLFSGRKKKGLIICTILFFISGFANIIPKLYGEHPNVTNDNNFFFWTNIIIIPVVLIVALKSDGLKAISMDIRKISKLSYAYIFAGVALSNIGSLVSIFTLRFISSTIYAVLSSSLTLMLTAVVSVLLYKEKISKQSLISVSLSIVSIILGIL